MKEDEVRALEELERAWGLRCGPPPEPPPASPGTGLTPDDGAPPPNFLLVEETRSEREEHGRPELPSWLQWAREVREDLPPLFTLETPWLTALVCLVTVLATAAVMVVALGARPYQ